jgi:hypothetical protein
MTVFRSGCLFMTRGSSFTLNGCTEVDRQTAQRAVMLTVNWTERTVRTALCQLGAAGDCSDGWPVLMYSVFKDRHIRHCSLEQQDRQWLVTVNWYGNKLLWPNMTNCPRVCREGLRRTKNLSVYPVCRPTTRAGRPPPPEIKLKAVRGQASYSVVNINKSLTFLFRSKFLKFWYKCTYLKSLNDSKPIASVHEVGRKYAVRLSTSTETCPQITEPKFVWNIRWTFCFLLLFLS